MDITYIPYFKHRNRQRFKMMVHKMGHICKLKELVNLCLCEWDMNHNEDSTWNFHHITKSLFITFFSSWLEIERFSNFWSLNSGEQYKCLLITLFWCSSFKFTHAHFCTVISDRESSLVRTVCQPLCVNIDRQDFLQSINSF